MCGITGIFDRTSENISEVAVRKAVNAIRHRGPDGDDIWCEDNIGLGHSRLAIIDLSDTGTQPMMSRCGRYVLVYNGEIYSSASLKCELRAKGYEFRGTSDTEVVLYSLIEWGEGAIKKFNGMFAFALWDRKKRELLLSRDRYGIKPLYYSLSGNTFRFGSEQRAICALSDKRYQVDTEGLYEYFTFQNLFSGKTFLKGITLLKSRTLH